MIPVTDPVRALEIAVLPGDGIGPEVMTGALEVLRAAVEGCRSVRLNLTEHSVGAGEYLQRGDPLPETALEACRQADAVLLGAMGLPHVRWPDGREMAPQIDLREKLDLYCGVRPIRLYHPGDTPLKGHAAGSIDFVIVRESTEGLFSSRLEPRRADATDVRDVLHITRRGSERLFRAAFRLARQRRGKVTLVDKANVLPSMVFFRRVFDEVAAEFSDVATERVYVDAAALYLVQRPQTFDVLVTENMFGDILSDLAAGLVGGMGLAPSADIGDECAVFQPSHGTAPDIAGKGVANPIAMVLSVAMMLEWLGHAETIEAAARIRRAVETVLADPGQRTADLGGRLTTSQMIDAVLGAARIPGNADDRRSAWTRPA
jgi:3-isopropylmalate dehydrogenase